MIKSKAILFVLLISFSSLVVFYFAREKEKQVGFTYSHISRSLSDVAENYFFWPKAVFVGQAYLGYNSEGGYYYLENAGYEVRLGGLRTSDYNDLNNCISLNVSVDAMVATSILLDNEFTRIHSIVPVLDSDKHILPKGCYHSLEYIRGK